MEMDDETDVKIDSYHISLDKVEKPLLTDRLNIITERFNVINKQLTQFRVQADQAKRELGAVKTPESYAVKRISQPLFEDEPEFVFDFK